MAENDEAMQGICNTIKSDKTKLKMYNILCALLIVSFNVILVLIVRNLIGFIKFPTRSLEQATIVKAAFISQYFNTGIIIVLVNLNIDEHLPKIVDKELKGRLLDGNYNDYSPDWYRVIGT